jgi:hypothetical protein
MNQAIAEENTSIAYKFGKSTHPEFAVGLGGSFPFMFGLPYMTAKVMPFRTAFQKTIVLGSYPVGCVLGFKFFIW